MSHDDVISFFMYTQGLLLLGDLNVFEESDDTDAMIARHNFPTLGLVDISILGASRNKKSQ